MNSTNSKEEIGIFNRLKTILSETKYKVLFTLFTMVFWILTINIFLSLMDISDTFSFIFGLLGLLTAIVLGGSYIINQIKSLINK